MRVCIVSKFPPIEGGIAARTYWRVRQLLDAGHEVAVVTNAGCVEPEYRIEGCEEHLDQLVRETGLVLRDLAGSAPWHVPDSPDYLERLLNELLSVLRSGPWDVIESGYLVPYGIAGHLASRLTGIPHVVRHGGSDIAKFLEHPQYGTLLGEVLAGAERVVTDADHEGRLAALGARTEIQPVYAVDESVFRPLDGSLHRSCVPVSAHVGKINFHWRRKGLDRIVDWYALQEPESVKLRIIGQGKGRDEFARWAEDRHGRPLEIEPFVPPWEMPALLSTLDAVLALPLDNTVVNRSMLAAEARACGCCVVEDLGADPA